MPPPPPPRTPSGIDTVMTHEIVPILPPQSPRPAGSGGPTTIILG